MGWIQLVSSLAWPVVVILIVLILNRPLIDVLEGIRGLFDRSDHGTVKFPGGEVEIGKQRAQIALAAQEIVKPSVDVRELIPAGHRLGIFEPDNGSAPTEFDLDGPLADAREQEE